ncbi:hypothetical protein F0A16_11615 [Salinicola corii]|uniref:Uncharacterized protein n=1 Tax=Salinicola corii TaxID=2606937 RepID=A0A640WEE9_9GAMM|nr:hypothetical protein [Salinicola corii]KAA0018347.1 hypothetical protein F0A16_11615 [Salinicola corii]
MTTTQQPGALMFMRTYSDRIEIECGSCHTKEIGDGPHDLAGFEIARGIAGSLNVGVRCAWCGNVGEVSQMSDDD